MTAYADAIVAQVIAEHPLPSTVDALDPSSRRYLEMQATKARMTPEALLAVSRARASMSAGERFAAKLEDARNLAAGQPMAGPGEADPSRIPHDLDAIAASAYEADKPKSYSSLDALVEDVFAGGNE